MLLNQKRSVVGPQEPQCWDDVLHLELHTFSLYLMGAHFVTSHTSYVWVSPKRPLLLWMRYYLSRWRKDGIQWQWCLLVSGKARPVDIEVHCSNYTDGELAYANATVNRNTVRENHFCLSGTLTGVQFNFMILGTVTTTRVEGTSYDWAGGSCRTSWSGYARCLCLDNSTNVFTYQVRFIANKKVHSRLYLTFDTDCAGVTSPGNPFTVDHSSCDPIPVVYGKLPSFLSVLVVLVFGMVIWRKKKKWISV